MIVETEQERAGNPLARLEFACLAAPGELILFRNAAGLRSGEYLSLDDMAEKNPVV